MISVVIPIYNNASTIGAALDSVLAQKCFLETIVVDDGSDDKGTYIARKFPTTVIRQRNQGAGAARNTGMKAATQPYVAFLDADDQWNEQHIEWLIRLTTIFPECSLFGNAFDPQSWDKATQIYKTGTGSESDRPMAREVDYLAEFAAGRPPFFTSTCMVKRDRALALGGFPAGDVRGEDIALWFKLSAIDGACASRYVGCKPHQGQGLTKSLRYLAAQDSSFTVLGYIGGKSARACKARLRLMHCIDLARTGHYALALRALAR